ncbi:MAG: site-specific integrase [SAR324 cluster bacterium]|nr:site-specific integrase [SAR324 cluster bacterium]
MNSRKLISSLDSGNTFYFRKYIPTDLIDYFNGVKQFRISLKCAIKSRSIRITKILEVKVSSLFDEIRMGKKSLDIEQIKGILRIEIRKQILHSHRVREGTNRWDNDGINRSLESIRLKESNLKETLKSDPKFYKEEVESKLEGILDSLDINVEKNSLEFQKLRNNFIDLYLLRHDWMRDLVNQTGKSDDDFKRNAQEKIGINLFPELQETSFEDVRENLQKSVLRINSKKSDSITSEGKKFSDCANLFYERKKLEETSDKELGELKRNINDFIEVMGDLDISQINKGIISDYISYESKLPPQRRKSAKYRDLSIQQLLELKDIETQSNQNINKRISKLGVFANWCVRQGLIGESPFKDMRLSIKKKNISGREPFTIKELRKILAKETFLKWTINFHHRNNPSHNEKGWFAKGEENWGTNETSSKKIKTLPTQPSGAKNQLPYYWIFPLGILSGMRTNEMCQLRCSDIKKVNGIWMIHVEDTEDTNVKSVAGIRKVPVHPQLIKLGLIDYIAKLRRKKKDRIFWELTKSRDGYIKQVSRHYNERVLPSLGIWKKRQKVLYCTRHTFINKLYSERVDENVIKNLVGHEKEFTMKHYGGDPFSPERLLEEISKVDYSGIKWSSLKI